MTSLVPLPWGIDAWKGTSNSTHHCFLHHQYKYQNCENGKQHPTINLKIILTVWVSWKSLGDALGIVEYFLRTITFSQHLNKLEKSSSWQKKMRILFSKWQNICKFYWDYLYDEYSYQSVTNIICANFTSLLFLPFIPFFICPFSRTMSIL